MALTIRLITTGDDLTTAQDIRREVFVVEQKVPEWLEIDEYEAECTHLLALADGRPVGTARWRTTSEGTKLERFAVLAEYRSRGVGKELLKTMLKQIDKSRPVYLNAQVAVIPFYSRFGFRVNGPEFSEADIPHRKMLYTID